MIGKKKFRFGERAGAAGTTDIPLTREDEENLETYVARIRETITILRHEIDSIQAGNLEVVGEVFEQKSKTLKWLELRTPLVEPFLKHDLARKLRIREHLAELRSSIEEDGAILSRIAVAARTVRREMERVTKRNGLDNVYGKSGQKLIGTGNGKVGLDREF